MKIIYLDTETTGIVCPESGLIQLAGAIEIDGEVVERFNFQVRPFPKDVVSNEALTINGVTDRELALRDRPGRVFSMFLSLLERYVDRFERSDKFHLVGYNARFDAEHLRAWFEKNGDKYFGSWFWHPAVDVMNFAATVLMGQRPDMGNFKLATVAEALGIPVDEEKIHDASYDIELTRLIFRRLLDESVKQAEDTKQPHPPHKDKQQVFHAQERS